MIVGQSVLLDATAGQWWEGSNVAVWGLTLKRALVGNLTIYGMTAADGSAQSWVITAGTGPGYVAAPGTGATGGRSPGSYSYANAADAGAAFVSFK